MEQPVRKEALLTWNTRSVAQAFIFASCFLQSFILLREIDYSSSHPYLRFSATVANPKYFACDPRIYRQAFSLYLRINFWAESFSPPLPNSLYLGSPSKAPTHLLRLPSLLANPLLTKMAPDAVAFKLAPNAVA